MTAVPLSVSAGTASQTNWSGGPGVWGPVTSWYINFYESTGIRYDFANLELEHCLEQVVDSGFAGVRSVYAEDINDDGHMDVLAAAHTTNEVAWWENEDGSGATWTKHLVTDSFQGACAVCAEDVDGDGDMDVLGAADCGGGVVWWENEDGSGTSWTTHTINLNLSNLMCVDAADIDGDNDIDAVAAPIDNGFSKWYENGDGSGTVWTEHHVTIANYSACAEDIDGDGNNDILNAYNSSYMDYPGITWSENANGSGTSWTNHEIVDQYYVRAACAADIDGDGDLDVIGTGRDDAVHPANTTWWENQDGAGTSWFEHTTVNSCFGDAVHSEDLDGDGDMDILVARYWADEIYWLENRYGTGSVWDKRMVDEQFNMTTSIFARDIDGDGSSEILGGGGNCVSWWEVLPTSGYLESSVLDVQESPDWQSIDWTCTEPSGTDVTMQVRASDDPFNMGTWSDTLDAPCSLEGIVNDGDSLFQYKVILISEDSVSRPVFHDVTVAWNPTGIEGVENGSTYALYGAQPNPAAGKAVVVFYLPHASYANITVYDLAGRIVRSVSSEFESGMHEVTTEGMDTGVYLVRMVSGDFTATNRFVLIE